MATHRTWLFDVSTGRLIDLKIDFPEILSSIQEIYDLTKEV
jgi:carbonic anhydrase